MIDMTSYKTSSRLSPHINAGASARLNLQPMVSDLSGEAHAAFCHGWRTTNEAENRAGRPMPLEESQLLEMAAAAQRAAHGPASRIAELIGRMRSDLNDPSQADRLDAMAGRAGGAISPPCQHCGGGPVYCRHCMAATSMVGG